LPVAKQKRLSARSHGDITDGKLTGQKLALKVKEVWSIRARLELRKRVLRIAIFRMDGG
jgi:hypothetical protein